MGSNKTGWRQPIIALAMLTTFAAALKANAAQVDGSPSNVKESAKTSESTPEDVPPELRYVLPDACRIGAFEMQPTLDRLEATWANGGVFDEVFPFLRALYVGRLENVERIVGVGLPPRDEFSTSSLGYWIVRAEEPIQNKPYFARNLISTVATFFAEPKPTPMQLREYRYWVIGSNGPGDSVRAVHFVDEQTAIVTELDLLLELIPEFHRVAAAPENSLVARLSNEDLHGTYASFVSFDLMRGYINRLQFTHLPAQFRRMMELAASSMAFRWQFDISADNGDFVASARCDFADAADAEEFVQLLNTHREDITSWLIEQHIRADGVNPTIDQFIKNTMLQASITRQDGTVNIRSTEAPVKPSLTAAIASLEETAIVEFTTQRRLEDVEQAAQQRELTEWERIFPIMWEDRAGKLHRNLRAVQSIYDRNKFYFSGNASHSDDPQPRLSWRVATLPHAAAKDLYQQFDATETWQSATNKPLMEQAPSHIATIADVPLGHSNVLSPYGPLAAFGEAGDRVMLAPDLLDGLANTVCLVEVSADHSVPWTQPIDFRFDSNAEEHDWPEFGLPDEPFVLVGTMDGKVHRVRKDIGQEAWQRLFNRADGAAIDWEELEYRATKR